MWLLCGYSIVSFWILFSDVVARPLGREGLVQIDASMIAGSGSLPHNVDDDFFCEQRLDACWQGEQKTWSGAADCSAVRMHCEDLLCTGWMQRQCLGDESELKCARADAFCQVVRYRRRPHCATSGNPGCRSGTSRPLMLMHIPKTAGTAVEQAAHSAGISWGSFLLPGRTFLSGRNHPGLRGSKIHAEANNYQYRTGKWWCSTYHTPPRYLADARPYQLSDVFCVTRHPYDRAVSEYSYLLSRPWGKSIREPELYRFPACSAKGLNHFLQSKVLQYQSWSKFINDCHFLPQSEYIWGSKGEKFCSSVLRLEDFPENFNSLMARRGYRSVRLPDQHTFIQHTAAEHKEQRHHETVCSELSVAALSFETRRALDSIYEEDFQRLGYSRVVGASTEPATQ